MRGKLGGEGGGREREERAARWRAAVVKLSGSEADIEARGFRRSSTRIIAAVYTLFWFFSNLKIQTFFF